MIYNLHFENADAAIAALSAAGIAAQDAAGKPILPTLAMRGTARVDVTLANGTGVVLAPTGKMVAAPALPGVDAPQPDVPELAPLPGLFLAVSGPDGLQFPATALLQDAAHATDIADIPAAAPEPKIISAIEFMGLFAAPEQAALFASADPHLTQFRWMAAAAGEIDLHGPVVTQALQYLAAIKVITRERVAEIQSCQPPKIA